MLLFIDRNDCISVNVVEHEMLSEHIMTEIIKFPY